MIKHSLGWLELEEVNLDSKHLSALGLRSIFEEKYQAVNWLPGREEASDPMKRICPSMTSVV